LTLDPQQSIGLAQKNSKVTGPRAETVRAGHG
jgi:hypothetical protein